MAAPRFTLYLIAVALVGACAGSPPVTEPSRPVPESARSPAPVPTGVPLPRGVIALEDAKAAALVGSPDLSGVSWEIRAAEARAIQAGLYPNPELEFEIEEFGGTGPLAGTDAAEYTVALTQEIPLGGKLEHRERVADLEGRLAGLDYQSARLDVLTRTTKAFVAVLAAQDRLSIERESVKAAEEVARAVSAQVASGKTPPLEEQKATVALSLERLRLERVERQLLVAKKRLAATWGSETVTFDSVAGNLTETRPVPSAADLVASIGANPDLARFDTEVRLFREKVESERAEAWPDLTIAGGVKHFAENDEQGFVAGFSVPLPLFDRNQGNVGAAIAESERIRDAERAASIRIRTELADAYQELTLASREAVTLRDGVVPAATKAFEAASAGFKEGKFGYLDVLDAQRTLFAARSQLIDALAAYHRSAADVERLVGRERSRTEGEDR